MPFSLVVMETTSAPNLVSTSVLMPESIGSTVSSSLQMYSNIATTKSEMSSDFVHPYTAMFLQTTSVDYANFTSPLASNWYTTSPLLTQNNTRNNLYANDTIENISSGKFSDNNSLVSQGFLSDRTILPIPVEETSYYVASSLMQINNVENILNSTIPVTDTAEQSLENNTFVSQVYNNTNLKFSVTNIFTTTPLLAQTRNSIAELNISTTTIFMLSNNSQSNNNNLLISQSPSSDIATLPTPGEESLSSAALLSSTRFSSRNTFDVDALGDNISLVSQGFAKNFTPSNTLSSLNTDESNPTKTNSSKY